VDYKELILIVGVWLAGCMAGTSDSMPSATPAAIPTNLPGTEVAQPVDDEVVRLAAEYSDLRAVAGQFDGGEWNDEVDQWMGRKHTLMVELGTRLGAGSYSCADLTQLLGPPDHIVAADDPLSDLISSVPGYETAFASAVEFPVYEWRGTHDFLFFTCRNDLITASDWWYAGE
jgi:hypothetical protein